MEIPIRSLGFIFFSWFMWPTWIPFSVYALEPPNSRRKNLLLLFALAGAALGITLFVPHMLNPDWVRDKQRVGITAGASAPEDLVQEKQR